MIVEGWVQGLKLLGANGMHPKAKRGVWTILNKRRSIHVFKLIVIRMYLQHGLGTEVGDMLRANEGMKVEVLK